MEWYKGLTDDQRERTDFADPQMKEELDRILAEREEPETPTPEERGEPDEETEPVDPTELPTETGEPDTPDDPWQDWVDWWADATPEARERAAEEYGLDAEQQAMLNQRVAEQEVEPEEDETAPEERDEPDETTDVPVEDTIAISPGHCPGVYLGSMIFSDPNLAMLGIDRYEIPFSITIGHDEMASMSYAHGDSIHIPLGEGMVSEQSWRSEASLSGRCSNGELQLSGTEISRTSVKTPGPYGDVQVIDTTHSVSARAFVRDGIIEGSLSWAERPGETIQFRAVKQ